MWAQVENGVVTRLYVHATPLLRDNVNYPPGVYKDAVKLRTFGIFPVRRVQVNAPEDTHGWQSSESFSAQDDHVRQDVTWSKKPNFDDLRVERTEAELRIAWDRNRLLLEDFMYEKGLVTEGQMTSAKVLEFEDWLSEL